MNLKLIGYRGTGKTTVARQLALALGWDWVDADVEVELRAGRSIAAIFADSGEAAFRDLESQVLADLVTRDRAVVALGGGVVLRPENRARLAEGGPVVWLRADPETILARVEADATTAARRPQLTSRGGLEEVRQLLAQREPWYRQCASLEVDTRGKSPAEIAAEIVAALPLPGAGAST